MTVHSDRLEVIQSEEEIIQLASEWFQLAMLDPGSTPYDIPEVALRLHRLQPVPGTPYIATLRDGHGTLVALLPLQSRLTDDLLAPRHLSALTGWHGSFIGGITHPSHSGAMAELLRALQRRRDWDLCELRHVRGDDLVSGWGARFRGEAVDKELMIETAGSPVARPGGTRNHRHRLYRLQRMGSLVFNPAEPPANAEEIARRFGEMHTERWSTTTEAQEFASGRGRAVLMGLIADLPSIVRAGTLRMDGEIIACHVALRWKNTQYGWRVCHDQRWHSHAPGTTLYELMISAASRDGCCSYSMGRGTEEFKRRWHPVESPIYRATIRGSSLRGRTGAAIDVVRNLVGAARSQYRAG